MLSAWKEFIKGKRKRKDVQEFQLNLMDNILSLHYDLVNNIYKHGEYQAFNINDPKPRNIHKAMVRDRLLHHAVYRILYPFFNRTFISDSFSCRNNKGTHKAINRFREFGYKVSKNNTTTCWILKCDIKKFFANIDQPVLLDILKRYIPDPRIIWLLKEVIVSFFSSGLGKGLPLGNLTSQLFVNIYMNEFDQFTKHKLKAKYYLRYADDFVVLSRSKQKLEETIEPIKEFLKNNLNLELHPNKIFIKTLNSGIDFLGWTNFFGYRVLRTSTKRRMFRLLETKHNLETLNSYLGLLRHGNTKKIQSRIFKKLLFNKKTC
ncbi:MAG TPA: reverse transcriptase/maturase family protein [Candidatus Paceibacterota bacterium]